MELNNKELELNNNIGIEKEQKNFLESALGKIINTTIDIGIRSMLPEFIEEQVIDVKDNLFNYGIKEGITKTIDDAIELGKSAIGMVTGKFDNVKQMENVVKAGGLIDGVSSLLDTVLNKAGQAKIMDRNILNTISNGKDIILNNLEKNIERDFTKQYTAIENTNIYIDNWKKHFENKNFEGMEKEFKKIEKQIKEIAPIETTINEAKTIEILHTLIKNNGKEFNLSPEQMELANKLR